METAKTATGGKKERKYRIWELDFVRGICIALMLMDHFFYDLAHTVPYIWRDKIVTGSFVERACSFARDYWNLSLRNDLVWGVVVGLFAFMSGLSVIFSRNNLLRTGKTVCIALAITGVTALMEAISGSQGYLITAGVIHTLAFCAVCYSALCEPFAKKVFSLGKVKITLAQVIAFVLCAVAVVLSVTKNDASPSDSFVAFFMGYPAIGFRSADYIPVLPWLAVYMAGAAFSPWIYPEKRSLFPSQVGKKWHKPFGALGKVSLWVYLVHQPLIYGLLGVIGFLLTGELRIF